MLDFELSLDRLAPVTPIRALRQFLQQHPDTEEFSTQQGLAQLVDRSESLVRAIEGGRMEVSRKFAKALSEATGVSRDWLMLSEISSEEVPSERGGMLRHEDVVGRIKRMIQGNLEDAATHLRVSSASHRPKSPENIESGTIQQQMATTMAKLVENALRESLGRGDTRLMEEITRLLARQNGSDDREAIPPVK